jgi:hypothetical protein
MFKPLDAPAFAEPIARAVGVGARAEGERAGAAPLEQSAVAVKHAAVVELGPNAHGVRNGSPAAGPATYSRPPPPKDGHRDETGTDAAAQYLSDTRYSNLHAPAGLAVVGGALVNAVPIQANPEATLDALQRLRAAALAPPSSPAGLQIAAQAAQEIQRAQAELARERYARDAQQTVAAPTDGSPPNGTDVRA